MRKRLSPLGIGFALSLAFVCCAMAKPITVKDLAGRKICWDYGNISTFGPGGKYSSSLVGEGTWSVTSVGVQISTPHFTGIMDIDKQPDGTFTSHLEKGSGKYCK
jgi:hypothetical protein